MSKNRIKTGTCSGTSYIILAEKKLYTGSNHDHPANCDDNVLKDLHTDCRNQAEDHPEENPR